MFGVQEVQGGRFEDFLTGCDVAVEELKLSCHLIGACPNFENPGPYTWVRMTCTLAKFHMVT